MLSFLSAHDKKLEGGVAYKLGMAHISSGNPQTAMKVSVMC